MAASSSIWHTSPIPSESRVDDGSDPIAELCYIFKVAQRLGDPANQLSSLKGLVQLLIGKSQWIEAAYFLNEAFRLVEPTEQASLYTKLAELEFYSSGKPLWRPPTGESIQRHRQKLQKIREKARSLFERGASPEEIQGYLTEGYQKILLTLVEESITLIGPPPEGFAMIALGSMARRELCPYSDLDFAFLVQKPSDTVYVERLADLLNLKIINLGETVDLKNELGSVNGFRMDGCLRLIGTPEELAAMQTEEWIGDIIAVNAMTTVSFLMGDPRTVETYKREVDSILDQRPGLFGWFSREPKLREKQARLLIEGHLAEFEPRLDQDKISLRAFDVKKELYRLPQTTLAALALHYGIKEDNTLELIDLLQAREVFSEEGARRLKETFRSILQLRIQTHLFYKTECEILYHARGEDDEMAVGLLRMTPQLTDRVTNIYQALLSFHQQARLFLRGDLGALASSCFYDPSIGPYDDGFRRAFQFSSADRSATTAAALDPNNPDARLGLGMVQYDLGNENRSVKEFKETLRLLREEHRDPLHPDIATVLIDLGHAYNRLGEHQKAIANYDLSLSISEQLYRDQLHPAIARTLSGKGSALLALGRHSEGLKAYELALEHYEKFDLRDEIATNLMNLGNIHADLGKEPGVSEIVSLLNTPEGRDYGSKKTFHLEKAVEFYQRALQYDKFLSDSNLSDILYNLADAFGYLGNNRKAIDFGSRSLELKRRIYEPHLHPTIADSLSSLGCSYYDNEEYELALDHHNTALKMRREILEKNGPSKQGSLDIAESLMNLGTVLLELEREASSFLKEAYTIYLELLGPGDPRTKEVSCRLLIAESVETVLRTRS